MLMAQPSTYDNFQTCLMLTAEPSTYDYSLYFHIFEFKYIETKTCHMLMAQPSIYTFFFKNANMSYIDGTAINI